MSPGAAITRVTSVRFKDIPNNTNSIWILDPALRLNMFQCIGLCMSLFFNGYDGSLLNGLQSIPQWVDYFNTPSPTTLGLMASSGFLPGIVAGFTADRFGYYLGRRATVLLGSLIATLGAMVMGISKNTATFCGGRAFMGFGVSFALVGAPPMLQEIAHPRLRAQIGGFYTCIYYVAAICSTAICLGTLKLEGEKSWRIPVFLQMAGSVLTFLMTMTAPESPRWLVKKGRLEQARAVLVKYHANGKQDDELVEYEWQEIQQALREEEENAQTRYTDYFRGSANRHRLLILLVVSVGTNWVGNGIISYYLSPILRTLGITKATTQLKIIIGMNVWNLVISTAAAVYVDKAGRRPLWLASTGGMLVSLCIVMGLSASYAKNYSAGVGIAVIPFLFLFFGSYDLAWTPLAYSYPIEILPFSMRTKGLAIFVSVQTAAVAANTWVNPVALAAIEWRYYGVYIGILSALCVIIWFFFPETKNLTIEEIAVVFDGDKAAGIFKASQGELATTGDKYGGSDATVKAGGDVAHVEYESSHK